MKKRNYWLERASKFVDYFVNAAEKIADKLGSLYFSASRKIEAETAKVFKAFERAFELSETEAKTLLAKTDGKTPSKAVIEAVNKITDPDLKRQAEAAISAPAYQYRMKRLDEIAKNGKKVCEELAQVETKTDTNFLKDQADKAYKRSVFDLQKDTGVSGSFTQVPKSHIEQMIKTNWSGRHYSERIWGNTQQLADELKDTLAEGFLTGASEQKMVKRIRERFKVGAFEARRLIRTESTYITEQAKLETYKAIHAEKYEYSALLDNRTSKICRKLDGKKFKVSEAQAGKNYPPMHPFCRSTTFSILPSEEELEKEWKKETADVIPENMEFEEWLDGLEETEDGKLAFKAEKSVDKTDKSDIIKLSEKFEIPPDKIKKFLLSPGAKHADEFFDVGYKESDYERLFDDIESKFDTSKLTDVKKNSDGTEDFSIFMDLGITSKKRFRTVWRKDTPNGKPRLITGHRED